MAILKLRTAPDPVLRRKASRVTKIDGSIRRLIDDMFETMYDAHGLGLAANQAGVPLRVLVMGIPSAELLDSAQDSPGTGPASFNETAEEPVEGDDRAVEEYVLVNPEFVKRSGERVVEEGCLSIPGYRGTLTRAERVTVKGLDRDGRPVRLKAEGLMAQALEHEIDHLDGILYIDHMKEQGTLDTLSEIEHTEPAEAAAG